ncbi:MAG TPA: glucokinase [Solirubrobacterales bacterium]|nr:glucokinase [Solirubrobacterales bacterium]
MADRSKAAPVVLAGDVGGTNTRLALFAAGGREPAALEVYPSADHASLDEIVAEFRAANPLPIAAATVGVAGPVRDGHVEVVNLPWPVDAGSLAATIGLPTARVTVINDLEAAAWGVLELGEDDLRQINDGVAVEGGTVALLSLGTGLGEAFITFGPGGPTVHASEGGHVEFGARSQLESELREWLAQADSHVSYEDVCSGMGLVRVYEFLRSRASDPEPEWLPAEGAGDAAAAISRAAIEGRDPLASQALDLVISIFGAQAGNLALTVLATGGVYLGGGIAPKILPRLEDGPFMDAFATKGRLSAVVEAIPVRVVLNELTGLLGAASHARARGL